MARLSLLLSLLGAACVSALGAPKTVPHAYVVEFEEDHDYNKFAQQIHGNATTRMNLDYSLFRGASIVFSDPGTSSEKALDLRRMPGIKNLWPLKLYSRPNPKVVWTGSSSSSFAHSSLRKRESADTVSTHEMTQVAKLRDANVTGSGIKIGIVDTGVDYTHPALGGCFGKGCLVGFGYDLVGDNYMGNNTPVADPDPMDCQGHGTHVSGIIAAQDNPYNFTGAAPGVTLGMYRVFGCEGDAGTDVLIAAYNMAYQNGSQVISASIGSADGWPEDPWAAVVSRIVSKGVPCVVAAGNDGDMGQFFSSTAADGNGVGSIASVDNVVTPAILIESNYSVAGAAPVSFPWVPGDPGNWTNISLPLWAPDYDTTNPADGCDAYPASTPDLSGFIVLVRRGTCTFVQKVANAVAHGAKYVIFYNNDVGAISAESTTPGVIAVAMTTPDVGAAWIAALKANQTVNVTMVDPSFAPITLQVDANNLTGGFLSTYTSWGPTWELDVKPQFAAVGGNVLSTWPVSQGSYAVLSGTSMATPLSAAIFALVAQVRKSFDPLTLTNVLSSTAQPALFNDGNQTYPFLAPVAQQGAGLLQAYDAAYATVIPSISSLSFNDTDHFASPLNITFNNTGSTDVTFAVSNAVAPTVYTMATVNGTLMADTFPNQMDTAAANLSLSTLSLTVPAGGSATLVVAATPPTGLDPKRLPVYSGWILLNSTSNGSSASLVVPYQGLAGSLHSATVLQSAYMSLSNDSNPLSPTAMPANTTFTLPPQGTANTTHINDTLPVLTPTLFLGSANVTADLVSLANGTNTTVGEFAGFPATYSPRGAGYAPWNGTLENQSYVPAGSYKVVVRALRIFGDWTNSSDWDSAETPPFNIVYETS